MRTTRAMLVRALTAQRAHRTCPAFTQHPNRTWHLKPTTNSPTHSIETAAFLAIHARISRVCRPHLGHRQNFDRMGRQSVFPAQHTARMRRTPSSARIAPWPPGLLANTVAPPARENGCARRWGLVPRRLPGRWSCLSLQGCQAEAEVRRSSRGRACACRKHRPRR